MHRLPVLFVAGAMTVAGCSSDNGGGSPAEAPATVEHPKTEAELTTVKLSADAIKRLGIQTVEAKTEAAAGTRTLGGEVVVPEGRRVQVTAPSAGTLVSANARAGARVSRGDPLFRLAPLVSAERDQRIDAQRDVTSAEAGEEAARLRLQRLEQLLKDGAASQRSVEEARAQHQVASAAVTAARARLAAISQNPVSAQGQIVISAPFDGIVQTVAAAQGQTVAAGAPLAEVAQVGTLWIRVAVYAGEVDNIDPGEPAAITTLGGSDAPKYGKRVAAPLTADPAAASVNLFFELPGAGASMQPGERVLVQLPLKGTERGLVIPDAALLYDINGGTWVYEDLGNGVYARRRIEVARHAGSRAVVTRGIGEGTKVVTAGAAELFGTEFGAGH